MTRILTFLALALILIVPNVQAQDFTSAQKEQIKKLFDEYLLENGENIVKSVELFQTAQEEKDRKASEALAKTLLKDIKASNKYPMTGNPKGDITLVEFFDYNCGYCSRALDELVKVLEKDKNLNVVFFDMPILGPPSVEASKWSLAAHKQDKYFEFHQALLNHKGHKNEGTFIKIAKDLGLDADKLKTDKDSKEIEQTLKDNVEQANKMNIRGTPGFIIDGKVFPGYMPSDQIFKILADIRADKK